MCYYAETCKSICRFNLVYNFDLAFSIIKFSFCGEFFKCILGHGNEAFPKGSSLKEIFPLRVIFHLLYSYYRDVKICFHSCRYQNQHFNSCRSHVVLVALATRVSFV